MPIMLPFLGAAVGSLFRRYGFKALTEAGKALTKSNVKNKLLSKGKTVTEKVLTRKAKNSRRLSVAGNIAGDAGTGSLLVGGLMDAKKIDAFKNSKELRAYVKANNPRLWKSFMNSPYSDIKKFLKSSK